MFRKKSENCKSQAPKPQLTESESTWAEIFPESTEPRAAANEEETRQAIRYMNKCVGLCMCPKCMEDFPIEHEYPVEKFAKPCKEAVALPVLPLFKQSVELVANVQTQASKQKPADSKVLVHGQGIPAHYSSMDETNLSELVKQKLSKNGFGHCKPIQAYGCQAILRGKNVALIGAAKSGKTLTYISAFCSILEEQEHDKSFPKNRKSPTVLVLVQNTSMGEEISRKFRALLNVPDRIWIASLPLDFKEISMRFSRHRPLIEVLIATPDCVIQLLHREIINFKRLCCVAVEQIEYILEKLQPSLHSIMDFIESTLTQRKFARDVQLITCSQQWTKKLEGFLGSLDSFPLIVIGNPMQAALYSRTEFQLQYLKSDCKAKSLTAYLQRSQYIYNKCIVICTKEDIAQVEKALSAVDIKFLTIHDEMAGEVVMDTQMMWSSKPCGQYCILICTDSVIHSYKAITDVNILIHYTLPSTWTQFSARFALMLDMYQCPLSVAFKEQRFTCKTMIFVDESTIECFLRIAYFFTENKIDIPETLQEHCRQLEGKLEDAKIAKKLPLCATLKTFGQCTRQKCIARHKFSDLDKCESDDEHLTGLMRGKLVHIKDVNCFYMRVDSIKSNDGKLHLTDAHEHFTAINASLKQLKILELPATITVGQKYIYRQGDEKYRCKVEEIVEFLKVGDVVSDIPLKVMVFGLDNGLNLLTTPDSLFEIDEQLAEIPATVSECIIAKLVPPFEESRWTQRAFKLLQHELEFYDPNTTIIEANILLKTQSTIWVNDMFIRESKGKCHMYNSICALLKEKHLFAESEDSLAKLCALWSEAGLTVPKYYILPFDIPLTTFKQPIPAWAHIKRDERNSMFLLTTSGTDCIFLRHATFDKILAKLQQRISKSITDGNKKLKDHQIQVGCVYALSETNSSNWFRVLLLEIDGDHVRCMYVDHGNVVLVPKTDLRLLNNDFITSLPFQAIQCSLYGIEHCEANEETIALIYDYGISEDLFLPLTAICLEESIVQSEYLSKTKYKIILYKDFVTSLNQVFIDLKLAKPNSSESLDTSFIEKLQAPHPELNEQDEEEVDLATNEMKQEDMLYEINAEEFDYFDLQIGHKPIMFSLSKTSPLKLAEEAKQQQQQQGYIPITAPTEESSAIPPQIRWYQSDSNVTLQFKFLENDDFTFKIVRNRFAYFETTYAGRNFVWNANLYNVVDKKVKSESKTHFIEVILTKVTSEQWPRLLKTQEHYGHIKYKLENLPVSDDESDPEEKVQERLEPNEIDPEFFKHIEFNDDGELVEYYSDMGSQESDYNESSDEDHVSRLC